MRIVRYSKDGKEGYGILEDEQVFPIVGLTEHKRVGKGIPMIKTRFLAPSQPTKIVCAGLNYVDHAAEMKMPIPEEPVMFIKPPSAVLGPGGTIRYPLMSHQVDYEAELAVVIGKTAKDVSPEQAKSYIIGYTCFNDVTARDLQRKDSQWTRAKSFDTFAPFGPWIETEFDPMKGSLIEAYLNGERRQSSSISNMVFTVYGLVSYISRVMTLFPGDVIATGTPPGIGPMKTGDEIEVRIEGIGRLVNTVG